MASSPGHPDLQTAAANLIQAKRRLADLIDSDKYELVEQLPSGIVEHYTRPDLEAAIYIWESELAWHTEQAELTQPSHSDARSNGAIFTHEEVQPRPSFNGDNRPSRTPLKFNYEQANLPGDQR
jgi:hypothetical protein